MFHPYIIVQLLSVFDYQAPEEPLFHRHCLWTILLMAYNGLYFFLWWLKIKDGWICYDEFEAMMSSEIDWRKEPLGGGLEEYDIAKQLRNNLPVRFGYFQHFQKGCVTEGKIGSTYVDQRDLSLKWTSSNSPALDKATGTIELCWNQDAGTDHFTPPVYQNIQQTNYTFDCEFMLYLRDLSLKWTSSNSPALDKATGTIELCWNQDESTMVSGIGSGDSEVQRTMTEFLNQLDGFDASNKIKVLMATNCLHILDQALLRPTRIDRKI
ncbi:26S protease regulatory subunit 8 homolog B-like protein [Tanacetum coccineum]